MTTSALLAQLRDLGVKLWADGDELGLSAPKGVLDAELVASIKAHKDELLRLLKNRARGSKDAATEPTARIEATGDGGAAPLSFSQRRLWFLDQLEPNTAVYNMPLAWTLRGALDTDALAYALSQVVGRHDVLRTRFVHDEGTPTQEVDAPAPIELPVVDVEGATTEARRTNARALLSERADEPFDLAAGPLLRPALLRLDTDEHVLFLLVHHIVFDGWSADVLLREVAELYAARVGGREATLPALPVQYADFARWQQDFLASAELERQLEVHRVSLGTSLPVLDLPTDRPRPAVQSYRGANASRVLSRELVDALGALARAENATLYMVLLAGYQALLTRWSRQTDLAIGTIVANRGRSEVEGLIGFFANTLVLRTDANDDPSFRTLVARAKDTSLSAFENQDVPFEKLVEELQPERNLAYTPLFQTIFMTEDGSGKRARMGDIELELFELDTQVARTDLMLTAHQVDGGVDAWVEYSTDLFERGTIERLLASYETLLASAVADPNAPLSRLAVVPAAERELVVDAWNDTQKDFPELPIHVQFEARADAAPDATALVFPRDAAAANDDVLTYRELDERANRLAHHLGVQGVAGGDLVGLCLDRSADMIVALLGILKTGAAYVPLDPAYPRDRIAYMADDAGLRFAVTTRALRELLPAGLAAIELDTHADDIASAAVARLDRATDVRDRMYVIYTSGSTGRPKGVELEHRSVSNFLASMAREPGFGSDDRLLAVTTLSFDISVLEVMLPLVTGGTLIVAPFEATSDGDALAALVERLSPTVMQATPATWRLLLLNGWDGDETLRAFCGGEALPRELADELVPRTKELWNLYGPTETTIWSACKRVDDDGAITIGRPIASTRMLVLDANLEPCPIGVPGELFIGGDGLARGYLGRPELTAERFVPDPFASRPNARMYRTGDEARWLANGELECLGRIDDQVKLRGFRIELGEIEAVLGDAAGIERCVCVVREDTPGDQRLTAYLVRTAKSEGKLDVEALRGTAREKLPAYMVPAAFVELDALPQTPNGKTDRVALRTLDAAPALVGGGEYVAPRNDTERAIAEVWSDVLGVERVAIDTNFFDLGGHSLLLAEVRGRLMKGLGIELTIIELFQYPTISTLAARLGTREPTTTQRNERGRDLAAGRKTLMQRRRIRR